MYIWRPTKTRLGQVALAIAGWTALGCLFALPDLSAGVGWREALLHPIAEWWSWGLLTPLIFWADRRMPFSGKQLGRRIAAHLLPSLFATSLFKLAAMTGKDTYAQRGLSARPKGASRENRLTQTALDGR